MVALPTVSSDRQCEECGPGFFQDLPGQLSCKPVTQCPEGFVEDVPATRVRDRTCKRQCFCTELVTVCDRVDRKDVYFLVDGSESVKRTDFALMKTLLVEVTESLLVNSSGSNRVAFAEFSDSFTQVSRVFESSFGLADEDISNIEQTFGLTFTATSIVKALSFMDAQARQDQEVTRVLVLITDGATSSGDVSNLPSAITELRNRAIDVIAVGVGRVEETELVSITGDADRVLLFDRFSSFDTAALLESIDATVGQVCTEQEVGK